MAGRGARQSLEGHEMETGLYFTRRKNPPFELVNSNDQPGTRMVARFRPVLFADSC